MCIKSSARPNLLFIICSVLNSSGYGVIICLFIFVTSFFDLRKALYTLFSIIHFLVHLVEPVSMRHFIILSLTEILKTRYLELINESTSVAKNCYMGYHFYSLYLPGILYFDDLGHILKDLF